MSQSVTPWYLDKAIYVTVLGILVPIVNQLAHLNLDDVKIASVLFVIATYIAAHKAKSARVLIAEIEHDALVSVSKSAVKP